MNGSSPLSGTDSDVIADLDTIADLEDLPAPETFTELEDATDLETVLDTAVHAVQVLGDDFLGLAILFVVLALLAAVVGARGIAGISMAIAKWLVILFIVLALVSLVL